MANIQDKKNTNMYSFQDLIYTRVAGNSFTHCTTSTVNVHTSRQHMTSHSSLITITQNNCVVCPGRAANVISSSRTNEMKTMNYLSDCFSLISPNRFFSLRNLLIFPLKLIKISLKFPYFLSEFFL